MGLLGGDGGAEGFRIWVVGNFQWVVVNWSILHFGASRVLVVALLEISIFLPVLAVRICWLLRLWVLFES